ncbi:MAG: hypothetical protein LBQ12_08120 [Deltaproteobacteria bacterium]|jgi:hypothetical protein|nr:hypothetical protein [Deltaproteobacteria bacterium]
MDKRKNKFPRPPAGALLPETASENVLVGSREHVDMEPAQRELTTLYDTIKNQNSQIETLTLRCNDLNIEVRKISGLVQDKFYLTFACLGCVCLSSLGAMTEGGIADGFFLASAVWAGLMTIPALLNKRKS